MKDQGLPEPKFIQELDFRTIIYRYTPQATPQATEQVTDQAIKEKYSSLLSFCKIPRSREEIQKYLGLQNRKYFRQEILAPLITAGLLTPTIPDKPSSPKQKYVIVENSGE